MSKHFHQKRNKRVRHPKLPKLRALLKQNESIGAFIKRLLRKGK